MAESTPRTKVGGMDKLDRQEDGCAFALRVERDGELTRVPLVDVQRSAYTEWVGDVPKSITYDRVYMHEDRITAEYWLSDGSLVEMTETEPGSGVFRASHHKNPSSVDPSEYELYRRPGKEKAELARLVEQGCSPAEALDYWMVEQQGMTATAWSNTRGRSHQAVSENVRKAREKIDA